MGGTGVVDRFLDIFSRYIDSGFGLLSGEVAFIATTLIVIDVTLAALFWSWGEADDGMPVRDVHFRYASALDRLDKSLIEASLDLGAGHLKTLFKVVVPLAAPHRTMRPWRRWVIRSRH